MWPQRARVLQAGLGIACLVQCPDAVGAALHDMLALWRVGHRRGVLCLALIVVTE